MSPRPEVTSISRHGFWILLQGRELFVSFRDFPWFRNASITDVLDLTVPHPGHLYWPRLDIDLSVESIEHPERYPLVSRSQARVTEPPPTTPSRR